ALTTLTGRYLYADLCGGEIRSALLRSPAAGDDGPVDLAGSPVKVSRPVGFGQDASNCVYVVSLDAVSPTRGTVYRLAPPGGAAPPTSFAVRLSATANRRQRILRQAGVRVNVRCNEVCTVRGSGSVMVGRKRYKLTAGSTRVSKAGSTRVLIVPLPKAAKNAV